MKFDVVWSPRAKQAFDWLWKNDPLFLMIAEAARRIDMMLADDPLGAGESRTGNRASSLRNRSS